jgi:hypothetical protein
MLRPGAKQELRVDERSKQRITRSTVESPQSLRLRSSQSQPRHFDVFAANPSQVIIVRL